MDNEWERDGMRFIEKSRQEYEGNCVFSSGYVEGAPVAVDTVYIRWQKDGDDGQLIICTPDELQAIGMVCIQTVWCKLLDERLTNDLKNDV